MEGYTQTHKTDGERDYSGYWLMCELVSHSESQSTVHGCFYERVSSMHWFYYLRHTYCTVGLVQLIRYIILNWPSTRMLGLA